MLRNLDGVYFRVYRDNQWQNICFTDLTSEEVDQVMQGRNNEWVESLYDILCETATSIFAAIKSDTSHLPNLFLDSYNDIQKFNGTRAKVYMLWSLIKLMAAEYDVSRGEPND